MENELAVNELRSMRKGCTRLGIGIFAAMVVIMVLGAVLDSVLTVVSPTLFTSDSWPTLLVNEACTYLIGPLVMWLILLPLPQAVPSPRKATPRRLAKLLCEAIALLFGFSLLTNLLLLGLSSMLGVDTGNLLESATEGMDMLQTVVVIVVIGPICEELIFRRMLLRRMLPYGERFAVVVSGLFFGLFHTNLYQFFYAFAVGMLFAVVMIKTGKLIYTIVLHMLLNLMGSVVPLALENLTVAYYAYVAVLGAATVGGIVLLILDWKRLRPGAPSRPGCVRAFLTSWGMWLALLALGGISVAVIFML